MALRTANRTFFVTLLAVSIFSLASRREAVAGKPAPNSIRVAIYADDGASENGLKELQKCLPDDKNFYAVPVTAKGIQSGVLDEFRVLIQPGGSGSKQAKTLGEEGRKRVKQFVTDGGGYIGICAGAYLASAEYPWSLRLLDAHVIDDAHWARGEGNVQLQISPAGQAALNVDKELCTIHFENGPLLGPGGKDDINDYELLASFKTEIVENGAPAGVMKGTAAIARGTFGKGRVQCFSPHPEKTPGREAFPQAAVRWVAKPQSGDRQ